MATETDLEARCRLAGECGSLMQQLASAKMHIAQLENKMIRKSHKLHALDVSWGDLTVVAEFEYSPPGGDGWNEPHYDAEVSLIYVWVSGVRMDFDNFPDAQVEKWEEQFLVDANELVRDIP